MKGELIRYALACFVGLAVGVVAAAAYYRSVLRGAIDWARGQYLFVSNERDFYKSQLEASNEK